MEDLRLGLDHGRCSLVSTFWWFRLGRLYSLSVLFFHIVGKISSGPCLWILTQG